jgi:hypothetical protein
MAIFVVLMDYTERPCITIEPNGDVALRDLPTEIRNRLYVRDRTYAPMAKLVGPNPTLAAVEQTEPAVSHPCACKKGILPFRGELSGAGGFRRTIDWHTDIAPAEAAANAHRSRRPRPRKLRRAQTSQSRAAPRNIARHFCCGHPQRHIGALRGDIRILPTQFADRREKNPVARSPQSPHPNDQPPGSLYQSPSLAHPGHAIVPLTAGSAASLASIAALSRLARSPPSSSRSSI